MGTARDVNTMKYNDSGALTSSPRMRPRKALGLPASRACVSFGPGGGRFSGICTCSVQSSEQWVVGVDTVDPGPL